MMRIISMLFLWFVVGCASTPYTDRRQLILISPQQETQLGITTYQQTLQTTTRAKNPAVQALVERVGRRIAKAANQPDYQWEFNTIQDDKTANAFALPGGKIAIYTGILPMTVDELGLAVVMSHEVAHAIARHGAERMTTGILTQLGQEGLKIAMQNKDPKVVASVMSAYGLGSSLGVALPFGRSQESEADHIGLILMAKAGYDPRGAVSFWERMKQAKSAPPEFLSTHPSDDTRIEQIIAWLPEVLKQYPGTSR